MPFGEQKKYEAVQRVKHIAEPYSIWPKWWEIIIVVVQETGTTKHKRVESQQRRERQTTFKDPARQSGALCCGLNYLLYYAETSEESSFALGITQVAPKL